MTYTYWIDKQGGSHYHKEVCPHIRNNPQYPYEPINRTKERKPDREWWLTRIREGGKYYIACPACYGKRRGEQMTDKEKVTEENVDIARWAFGAYQSYADKPASVEVLVYKDGNSIDIVYGQVNPCLFGDQCEGHACYCNHPNAYRKCHCSWYYGERELDSKCKYYEPNPYWQDGNGDFYEQREKTLLYLKEKGLLEITVDKVDFEAPSHYKNHKSKFSGAN